MPETFIPPKTVSKNGKRVGRPPSNMANQLVQREKAMFNKLASRRARKIIDAQTVAALGTYHILAISFDEEGNKHLNIVRDMKRQENLIESGTLGKDYFIVEGTLPDWRAGDAILNRAWGKPKETTVVEGDFTFSLRALHKQAEELRAPLTKPESRSFVDITQKVPLPENGSTEPLLEH